MSFVVSISVSVFVLTCTCPIGWSLRSEIARKEYPAPAYSGARAGGVVRRRRCWWWGSPYAGTSSVGAEHRVGWSSRSEIARVPGARQTAYSSAGVGRTSRIHIRMSRRVPKLQGSKGRPTSRLQRRGTPTVVVRRESVCIREWS
ncbi:hypothetical protein B0H16DRAFT_96961 [Mycena metata]|uniref:Secreted protein n=1 Tax=Mycena metata TaxID=1033252 RepID=A0AAD7IA09_9AGAR|nr:hypothetical protein B0H16DRAFT_96961 [Mycena metata]